MGAHLSCGLRLKKTRRCDEPQPTGIATSNNSDNDNSLGRNFMLPALADHHVQYVEADVQAGRSSQCRPNSVLVAQNNQNSIDSTLSGDEKFKAKCKSALKRRLLMRKLLSTIDELPEGFEQRKTSEGQVYFIHSKCGISTWHDPRIPRHLQLSEEVLGPVSPDWETRKTLSGRYYYVNHNEKSTQFTDPRYSINRDHVKRQVEDLLAASEESAAQSEREATCAERIEIFLEDLMPLYNRKGHTLIDISRNQLVEQSFRRVMSSRVRDLRRRLVIRFRNEIGIDYGGLSREWATLVSRALFDPAYGLFWQSGQGFLELNPSSDINPEHLKFFEFSGRILGMALLHQFKVDLPASVTLSPVLLKQLLGDSANLEDLSIIDPSLHSSLTFLLDNKVGSVLEPDTTFTAASQHLGTLRETPLLSGGEDIFVNEENKRDYVLYYSKWRCFGSVENQLNAMRKGFWDVVPLHYLVVLEAPDLKLLLFGRDGIDLDEWRCNTRLKNCGHDSPLVTWFWSAVRRMDAEQQARLLQFVTGSSRVPHAGFRTLRGSSTTMEIKPFTLNVVGNESSENLPRAHTCFNRLDLPPYDCPERVYKKLLMAIDYAPTGFNME